MTKHLETASPSPLQKSPLTCAVSWGAGAGLLMLKKNITVCSASYAHLWGSAGGHYRRWGRSSLNRHFGSDLSQPLTSNNSALISPAKANPAGRESWQILTLPTPLCLSVLLCWKFWGQGFGSFCTCPFPLQPSQGESILLSYKRLLQEEMQGKEHMTSNAVTTGERPPTLCFCFFPFFLKEFETNHMTKYFKINSQPLHRSHNEHVKVEWRMTGYNLLFKLKWNMKQKFNEQLYVILKSCRSVLPVLQSYFAERTGGRKKEFKNCGFLKLFYLGIGEIFSFGLFFFKPLPPFPKIINSLSVVGSSASVLYIMSCRDIYTHPAFRELYQKLDSLEQEKNLKWSQQGA